MSREIEESHVQRVKLDKAPKAVKSFFRSLPFERDDVELELDGELLCKISGPNKLSNAEKAALQKKGRALLKRSHERNKDVPVRVIAGEVDHAIRAIRGER